jgi:hypothetical protein
MDRLVTMTAKVSLKLLIVFTWNLRNEGGVVRPQGNLKVFKTTLQDLMTSISSVLKGLSTTFELVAKVVVEQVAGGLKALCLRSPRSG